jgi:hypothetical protein
MAVHVFLLLKLIVDKAEEGDVVVMDQANANNAGRLLIFNKHKTKKETYIQE